MMFINHNPFGLNDLITTNSLQQYQQLVQPANGSSTIHFPTQKPLDGSLYGFAQQPHQSTIPTQSEAIYNRNSNGSINFGKSSQNSLIQQSNSAIQSHTARSASNSSLSSVSSTSSKTSSPLSSSSSTNAVNSCQVNSLSTIHQPSQSFSKNMSLSNNCNLFSFNFAYINPPIGFNSAPINSITNHVQQSQQFINQGSKISIGSATTNNTSNLSNLNSNSNIGSYNSINDTLMGRQKDLNNDVLNQLNSNYQLKVLSTKNSNLAQYSSSPQTTSCGLVNRESGLNCNSPLILFNPTKSHQDHPNLYNHYDPSITYIPRNDLFLTNTNDQSQFAATYLSASSLPELTFSTPILSSSLQPSKQLVQTFSSKMPFTQQNGIKKRKKRFKKPLELRKVLPKNSLMSLHELRPNIEYRFLNQSGPIHKPTFKMCVEIEEHKFEGSGKTKKEARMMAAEKAVEFLLQNPQYIQKTKSQTNSSEQNDSKRMNDSENDENSETKIDDTSSSEESDSEEANEKRFKF